MNLELKGLKAVQLNGYKYKRIAHVTSNLAKDARGSYMMKRKSLVYYNINVHIQTHTLLLIDRILSTPSSFEAYLLRFEGTRLNF